MKLYIITLFIIASLAGQLSAQSNDTDSSAEIEITKFFPNEIIEGEVQFNIQVKNNREDELTNVFASIQGKGFSTYEVIPIETLNANEKDYIFVRGYFSESGEINLTIFIEDFVFYQMVSVVDVFDEDDEREKLIQKINELSMELDTLKKNYTDLEIIYTDKKENNYDVSRVDLSELKKFLRETESGIISEDVDKAEVNLRLSYEEYYYQKNKLDTAKIIPVIMRLRESALIFSTIIGAVLAFFALSELLKRKGESVYGTVKKIGNRKPTKKYKK